MTHIYILFQSLSIHILSIMAYQRIEYSSLCHGRTSLFIHSLPLVVVALVAKLCLTLVTTCTVAWQSPLSMGFPRKEYWSGLPFLSLGHLPDPGIEPGSPALQVDSLAAEPLGKPIDHICWSQTSSPLPHPPSPLATADLFLMSMSLFLWYIYLYHVLESTLKSYHMVVVFLFLTYFI